MRMLKSNAPFHAQGIQNRTERTQSRVSIFRECSVKVFTIYVCFLSKLGHSFLCFRNISKGQKKSFLRLLCCGV